MQAALDAGWLPQALAAFTGANTTGVRNPYAVLAARLSPAELPPPPPQRQRHLHGRRGAASATRSRGCSASTATRLARARAVGGRSQRAVRQDVITVRYHSYGPPGASVLSDDGSAGATWGASPAWRAIPMWDREAGINEPVMHEPQAEPELESAWQPGTDGSHDEAAADAEAEIEM